MLIHQLKAEIFELQAKAGDYNSLKNKMIESELAYRRLLEEKSIFEDDLQ